MSNRIIALAAALLGCVIANSASSTTVLETSELIASDVSLDSQLPAAVSFEVAKEGNYVVTLRDINTPALLSSLRAIVTHDLKIVANLEVAYQGGTAAPATATFTAPVGRYRVHVLGSANPSVGTGGFAVSVDPEVGGTSLIDHADVIVGDSPAGSLTQSVFTTTFQIAQAGNYQLTLTDHAFPAALASTPSVLLVRHTATGTEQVTVSAGAFSTSAGLHDLIIIANADATAQAGLYSVRVNGGPSSALVYQSANPVGRMPPPVDLSIPSAGQYAVTVTDTKFPAALTSVHAAVVQSGVVLDAHSGEGSFNVNAAQAAAQLFSVATANEIGAYTLRVAQGATVVYAGAQISDASPATTTPSIFAFAPRQALAAGNYRITLEDFEVSSPFASLSALVTQGDQVIDHLNGDSHLDVSLQAERLKVIVAARPAAGDTNALFGINLTTLPDNVQLFESTQGIGGLFRPTLVTLDKTSLYDIDLADLQFPAALQTGILAITQGTQVIGRVVTGGAVRRRELAAGTYVLNFLAKPASGQQYGAYAVKIADSVPTVTFTADPTSITEGERSTLQWTTSNATSCTASNGWSGSKDLNGSQQTDALRSSTTFVLRCAGPGGETEATATVSVSQKRKGGGGAMGLSSLLYMGVGLLLRRAARERAGRGGAALP